MGKSKPFLIMTAPVGTRSGYGSHAVDIANALIEMDRFDIKIGDVRWGSTPRNALKIDNPDHIPIIQRLINMNQPLNNRPDIHVHLVVPNEYQTIAKFNIGITAGIETTMCSADWIMGLNRMDLNIVPSEHAKNVFTTTVWTQRDQNNQPVKQLKCEKPIEVLFEGFNSKIYRRLSKIDEYPKPIADKMKEIHTTFNFLFVGHWLKGDIGQDRKDVGMLVKTFIDAFKDEKNPPGLILKTSGAGFSVMDREELTMKINSIKSSMGIDVNAQPPIYLLHGELTDEEMNALYNHPKVKVHISFTKGEGFGRPLLEASISGKPIIASGWSGQMDFLNKDLSVLLPGQITDVHKSAVWEGVIVKESKWFTVNYGYAIAVMKDIYRNYQKYELNAKKLGAINEARFTREKMKKKFEEILNKYLPEFPSEVSISLPNLPKLRKISGIEDISSPDLQKNIILPKLKRLNAEEPAAGSNEAAKEDTMKISLPRMEEPDKMGEPALEKNNGNE